MAHGRSEAGLSIAIAALAAAAGLDQEQQRLYVDVVLSSLNEADFRRRPATHGERLLVVYASADWHPRLRLSLSLGERIQARSAQCCRPAKRNLTNLVLQIAAGYRARPSA